MSKALIGDLRANLGLDSSKFRKGARGVNNPLRDMRRQFMVVGAAAAAFGGAVTAAALKGAKQIDNLAKSSRRLDASIGGFRALQLAADDAGINLSSLTNDVQTMNRELSRAGEGGPIDDALARLGMSGRELLSLDVDSRIAAISDRIKELGINSGTATAILQDMGVRNREMALLMIGGGDAIRSARDDIDAYGLALNDVDASRIETANDQISRLSIITERFGQQLALEIVPTLGRMAEAFTESMREGGLLRGVIDGLAGNIQRIGTYVTTAVALFGGRYVVALVAAAVSTAKLSGALVFLRGALIRTGFGALIVGAGELVYQFGKLISRVGGFGESMRLMKDVSVEVWERIKLGGQSMGSALGSIFARVRAGWLSVLANMQKSWSGFLRTVSNGLANVPGMDGAMLATGNAAIMAGAAWVEMSAEADAAKAAADGMVAASGEMAAAAVAPLKAMEALRDAMTIGRNKEAGGDGDDYGGAIEIAAPVAIDTSAALANMQALAISLDPAHAALEKYDATVRTLNESLKAGVIDQVQYNNYLALAEEALNDVESASGGAGAATSKMSDAMREAADAAATQVAATEKTAAAADNLGNTFASAFADILTGTDTVIGGLAKLAGQLGKMALMEGLKGLFGKLLGGLSGGGNWLADLFGMGANANGTENWRGGMSLVGERGPEIVDMPRGSKVYNAQATDNMLKAKPQGPANVSVEPKIINLFDMSVVGDWLSGPDGEQIILNHMTRNGVVSA